MKYEENNYDIADYVLNHYSKNSVNDIKLLAKEFEALKKEAYNIGFIDHMRMMYEQEINGYKKL